MLSFQQNLAVSFPVYGGTDRFVIFVHELFLHSGTGVAVVVVLAVRLRLTGRGNKNVSPKTFPKSTCQTAQSWRLDGPKVKEVFTLTFAWTVFADKLFALISLERKTAGKKRKNCFHFFKVINWTRPINIVTRTEAAKIDCGHDWSDSQKTAKIRSRYETGSELAKAVMQKSKCFSLKILATKENPARTMICGFSVRLFLYL